MIDDVEMNGSAEKRSAVTYAIIFSAYLLSLTVLAILAVSPLYFFTIAILCGYAVMRLVQKPKQPKVIVKKPQEDSNTITQAMYNKDGLSTIDLDITKPMR